MYLSLQGEHFLYIYAVMLYISSSKMDKINEDESFNLSFIGVMVLSKAKGGTGRGTDKKGWNRWQAAANRAKSAPKPYTSKGTKNADSGKTNVSKPDKKSD
jgi:hypothetical protein